MTRISDKVFVFTIESIAINSNDNDNSIEFVSGKNSIMFSIRFRSALHSLS